MVAANDYYTRLLKNLYHTNAKCEILLMFLPVVMV